jgi:hypothetical protein
MTRGVIDRIVEDAAGRKLAAILLGEEEWEINIPLQFLPEGAKEGDILDLGFQINHEATKNQKQRITNLIQKLKNKPRSD